MTRTEQILLRYLRRAAEVVRKLRRECMVTVESQTVGYGSAVRELRASADGKGSA